VLRSRLARLGFGTTAPGVWIAPAHLADEARHMLERLDLSEYVDLFRADYLAYADPRSAAARWWDLAAVQGGYADFTARFQDADAHPGTDAAAFGAYLRAVDAWRRLPYRDPGLPPELLPDDWCGAKASDVFFALHDNLREPGLRYVRGVVGG
jgi:phenylacetic acid degradation operon negative regulatory protein